MIKICTFLVFLVTIFVSCSSNSSQQNDRQPEEFRQANLSREDPKGHPNSHEFSQTSPPKSFPSSSLPPSKPDYTPKDVPSKSVAPSKHQPEFDPRPSHDDNRKFCNFCRDQISGRYLEYETGHLACTSCQKRLPKCKTCGLLVKDGVKQDGHLHCMICARKALQCDYCQKHLFGRYWEVGENRACNNCRETLPACDRCGRIGKNHLKVGDKSICSHCASEVDHCARCRVPLLERFYQFANDHRKFCKDCTQSNNRCDICNKPFTDQYYELSDKRSMCHSCIQTAVQDEATAREVLDKTLSFLQNRFKMNVRLSTRLNLINAQTMEDVRSKHGHLLGGHDTRALGLFVREGESFEIYVESLLPYSVCMAVMAHEYTHAWQADYFSNKTSLLWLEGLAEWVSYKTLEHYGYENQAALIPLQKDVYGQGFHMVSELEEKYGESNVVTKVLEIVNH